MPQQPDQKDEILSSSRAWEPASKNSLFTPFRRHLRRHAEQGNSFGTMKGGRHRYSICDKQWQGLDILDLGFLADLAYEPNLTATLAENRIKEYFPPDSCLSLSNVWVEHIPRHFSVRVSPANFRNLKNRRGTKYHNSSYKFGWSSKILGLGGGGTQTEAFHVVAVSGTNDPRDMYEDVAIWNEAGVLRVISMLIPIEWWWPANFVATLVAHASYLFFEPRYVDDLTRSMERLRASVRDDPSVSDEVLFTGHSLGGGIAAILG
eukprot:CAMPEP_0184501550 /NCGR_PEP_ID=MMETSP0113_2-20130426/48007_1 /TAXON_ID=91329 /ORGANISM="Norrisiella sphaerica, Strain BC52" /LENGTH=262 /DNA_ID=CAMNT_0026890357 /DNA_START=138 /DNA_END=922 /DNA_ORIENTATION=+